MKYFIKKMLSQESGYSGEKANQRGSYVSIPKKAWFYFPSFKENILNPKEFLTLKKNELEYFTLEFVWHNSKLFPEYKFNKKNRNNEKRIYMNSEFKTSTLIDKDSFLILEKNKNSLHSYNFKVINKSEKSYELISEHFNMSRMAKNNFYFAQSFSFSL